MTNTLNKIMHNGDEYMLPRQKALVITLTSAGWTDNEQTVTATWVTASNSIIISPVPTYISDYTDAKVYCSAQGTDSLTFTCDSTPASDIEVNVLVLSAEAWSTPTPPSPSSRPTITGFTYDSKSFWFGSQEQEVQGMIWKPDWTKFYLEWEWSDHVYQYSCSTAYDISTASYDNVSLDVSWKTGVPTNIRMKPDGTQLYLVWGWDSSNHIWIYNLGTAWDLSTAVYSAESPQIDNNTNSIFLSPDWLKLFTYSLNTYLLKRFPLSTAWDLTSFSTADQTASLTNSNNIQNVYFNPDGTQMFSLVRPGSWTKVGLYSLSTGWDLTTLSNTSTETIDSWDAMAISFKEDDWSKMYICWRTNPNRTIYQYSTTTA